ATVALSAPCTPLAVNVSVGFAGSRQLFTWVGAVNPGPAGLSIEDPPARRGATYVLMTCKGRVSRG
ncbi:hypothetical protein, partial [Catellatospora sp. NPDC049133]|uniref:hypothetical protein n=1 Tax=Catellatospora sp. NPDC049133 TaxID=3155499 RepID=UPI0033C7D523